MTLNFKNKLLISLLSLLVIACLVLAAVSLFRLMTETRTSLNDQIHMTLDKAKDAADDWTQSRSKVVLAAAEQLPIQRDVICSSQTGHFIKRHFAVQS